MDNKTIQEELQKCKESPYYFATNYLKVYDQDADEHPYTTNLSEEEFNQIILCE